MKQSQYYFLELKKRNKINIPLLLYSIGNTVFLAYIVFLYFTIIKNAYTDLVRLYLDGIQFEELSFIVFKAFIISVFLMLFLKGQISLIRSKLNTSIR